MAFPDPSPHALGFDPKVLGVLAVGQFVQSNLNRQYNLPPGPSWIVGLRN